MSVVFGESEKLESFFKIPQFLYGDFSVFGVDGCCKEAVEFALKTLEKNQRIEVLVLLSLEFNGEFALEDLQKKLEEIKNFGTKTYFFLKAQKRIPTLEVYKKLAENGIVFLSLPK